jgi:hypothetical protein
MTLQQLKWAVCNKERGRHAGKKAFNASDVHQAIQHLTETLVPEDAPREEQPAIVRRKRV